MLNARKYLLVVFVITIQCTCGQDDNLLKAEDFSRPEYVLPCNKTDPELGRCLENSFNHLLPYLVKGLTDLNVPSVDPMEIDRMVIENGVGPIKVRAIFSNITVTGGSNHTIKNIKPNLKDLNIDLSIKLPRLEIRGKYEINGNVLLLPIRSKGNFWTVFLDIDAQSKVYGKEVKNKHGVVYLVIDKMVSDFKIGKSRFRIRESITNGNLIGEAINQFLNSHSDEIIKEMKPAAIKAITKHFKGYLNSIFLKFPIRVLLPDY